MAFCACSQKELSVSDTQIFLCLQRLAGLYILLLSNLSRNPICPCLSQLSVGLYAFKVVVSGENAFGEGFVNVTVEPGKAKMMK